MLPECLENYAYLLAKCYCWHFDMERKAVQRIVMSMENLQMQGFYCLAKNLKWEASGQRGVEENSLEDWVNVFRFDFPQHLLN